MPAKYLIHTKPVAHRFEPVTKSGIIAWEEGCLKCAVCVKKMCVYGVHEDRCLRPRQMIDSIDNECMNCMRCVQNCPKELIHKSMNPEFRALGDSYFTPDIISRLWYQAETGKIPVSGAGYPGPFSGPGFDSMWTDMSEVVRPTRDGIHGREYISTAVDLGHKPDHLLFDAEGKLTVGPLLLVDIPMPILLKAPAFGEMSPETLKGWTLAAKRLGTFLCLPARAVTGGIQDDSPWMIPSVPEGEELKKIPENVRILEIPWSEDCVDGVTKLRRSHPSLLVSVKVPMRIGFEEKVVAMAREGVSVAHVEATPWGTFIDEESRHMKEGIQSVHLKLVGANVRDGMTLLASGGLAMAEHVAKAVICGADAVFIDFPILIALECRMCRRCTRGLSCPVEIDKAPSTWVAARTVNLFGAWHNQLLEVMGAMGIRDARRLRGEAGRAMFFEELDRSCFQSMTEIGEGCELE
ncbi:glutamate synthase-related protein [Thermodesulfobacteriota bacterium]